MNLKSFTGDVVRSSYIPTDNFPAPSARVVLAELFELLEQYGPTWYTEEHHKRAVAALRDSF